MDRRKLLAGGVAAGAFGVTGLAAQPTCAGTNIGTTLEFYINRPRPEDDPHGRGPTLLAGTEILAAKH